MQKSPQVYMAKPPLKCLATAATLIRQGGQAPVSVACLVRDRSVRKDKVTLLLTDGLVTLPAEFLSCHAQYEGIRANMARTCLTQVNGLAVAAPGAAPILLVEQIDLLVPANRAAQQDGNIFHQMVEEMAKSRFRRILAKARHTATAFLVEAGLEEYVPWPTPDKPGTYSPFTELLADARDHSASALFVCERCFAPEMGTKYSLDNEMMVVALARSGDELLDVIVGLLAQLFPNAAIETHADATGTTFIFRGADIAEFLLPQYSRSGYAIATVFLERGLASWLDYPRFRQTF